LLGEDVNSKDGEAGGSQAQKPMSFVGNAFERNPLCTMGGKRDPEMRGPRRGTSEWKKKYRRRKKGD